MERYEKYKDSCIEWIGDIPEHWKIVPIKRLVGEENTLFLDGDWIESKDIVFDTDGIRYITTGNIGEGIYKEQGLGYITQDTFDKLNCTEVLPFDLVISRLNPPIGRCCIIPDLGKKIVTSVDNVILRPNKNFNKGFLKYVMSNEKYFEYTSLIARGATMQRISRSLLGDINIPVSFDFNEQSNIATYLDRKTAEIDQIISNKQKLIALYEEEKQAMINQAVTKGLDPNVTLKDSGVEWLGQIPEHWEVKRIRQVAKIFGRIGYRGYTVADLVSEGEGAITISPSNMKEYHMDFTSCTYLSWEKYEESPEIKINNDDILFVKTGSTYGKTSYVSNLPMEATINPQIIVFKEINCNNKLLWYILKSENIIFQVEGTVVGGTIPTISQAKISNYYFPISPDFKEQQSIVAYIEKECNRLDTILEKCNKQLGLLKEYRTTLISEVVTGKIKVPNTIEA